MTKQKSFGLIETVVAIGFLVMVVTSLTYLMRFSLNAARSAGLRTTAYNLAQAKIEQLKLGNFPEISNGEQTDSALSGNLNNTQFTVKYRITTDSPQIMTVEAQNYRKVAVKVEWQEKGQANNVTLATYFTNVQ